MGAADLQGGDAAAVDRRLFDATLAIDQCRGQARAEPVSGRPWTSPNFTPAKAGVLTSRNGLDARLRGHDDLFSVFLVFGW